MKKRYLIFSIIIVVFSACETDFDVNAEYEETTIVYGLLDASQDTQYIKINKAFLCECNAESVAANDGDTINFNPDHLEVKLHKIQLGDTLISITLDTTLIDKEDDGEFNMNNNIIYRAITSDGFMSAANDIVYGLTIKNTKSGNEVSANTKIIPGFSFFEFSSQYPFGFYNPALDDSLKFLSKTMKWKHQDSKNGIIYQLDIIFNYTENNVLKSLVWKQPLVTYTGISMQRVLEGTRFFNFLSNNLEDDDAVKRNFVDLNIRMTVGTEDLYTYVQVNAPITGFVQERPAFTNINNGIGIFSSRYTYIVENIDLSPGTKGYLIDELERQFE